MIVKLNKKDWFFILIIFKNYFSTFGNQLNWRFKNVDFAIKNFEFGAI